MDVISLEPSFRLVDLPDEILIQVVSFIDRKADLRRCSRLCRRIHTLTEEQLYSNIVLMTPTHARNFGTAVSNSTTRLLAIKDLTIAPPDSTSEIYERYPPLYDLLPRMKRLRNFFYESEFCNSFWNRDARAGIEDQQRYGSVFWQSSLENKQPAMRGLGSLLSCTLNCCGHMQRCLDFDCLMGIFIQPTLQHLKISRAQIKQNDATFLKYHHGTTPLKKLEFEKCHFFQGALPLILAVPKALEEFSLMVDAYQVIGRPIRECAEAIEKQKQSLKVLKLDVSYSWNEMEDVIDLSSFLSLRTLQVRSDSIKFSNTSEERHSFISLTPDKDNQYLTHLPPDLEDLIISEIGDLAEDDRAVPRMYTNAIKTLKQYKTKNLKSATLKLQAGENVAPANRSRLETFRLKPWKDPEPGQIQFKIYRVTATPTVVAPFLYHEPKPSDVLIYDSFAKKDLWNSHANRAKSIFHKEGPNEAGDLSEDEGFWEGRSTAARAIESESAIAGRFWDSDIESERSPSSSPVLEYDPRSMAEILNREDFGTQ